MSEADLTFAEWLMASGAGRSARAFLDLKRVRGPEANDLRQAAPESTLRPGIYGMVVLNGTGLVVPIQVRDGAPLSGNAAYQTSCHRAVAEASRILGTEVHACSIEVEAVLAPDGDSLGLPILLAILEHFSSRQVTRPVLATGSLRADGTVGAVGEVSRKLGAADRELDSASRMTLFPAEGGAARSAGSFDAEVFGPGPFSLDGRRLQFEDRLERAMREATHSRAIEELHVLLSEQHPPADRFRCLNEIGIRWRHLGHSTEADRAFAEASLLLPSASRVVGKEAVDFFRIQDLATARDSFRLTEAESGLRTALQGLTGHRNAVHCRGALAQVLSMLGHPREAIELRTENICLQEAESRLKADLPQTYCNLAFDSGRAGDSAGFDRWVAKLNEMPMLIPRQGIYNAAAIVRGLVALERDQEALTWIQGGSFLGRTIDPFVAEQLHSPGPIVGHPEVSLARAASRALRRTSRHREAAALANRIRRATGHPDRLVEWLGEVGHLEEVLALQELGRQSEADELLASVRSSLPVAHSGATSHHAGLLTAAGVELERAIDFVWY